MNKPVATRDILIKSIYDKMKAGEDDIFFLSGDFGSPKLDALIKDFSNRFMNVGIAEQNLINVAVGLALEGKTVFAYAIAPFITMRCYEQIRVNIAILSQTRKMNINLIGVGAGFSYQMSGPTHHCLEDLSIMRTLPNFEICSISDAKQVAGLMNFFLNSDGGKYIRLDAQPSLDINAEFNDKHIQDGFRIIKEGKNICIIATGHMVYKAIEISEQLEKKGIQITVIDIFKLKNFSTTHLNAEFKKHNYILSLEEGFSGVGGLDAAIYNILPEEMRTRFKSFGLDSCYYFELGGRKKLHELNGIGNDRIVNEIEQLVL